MSPNSMLLQECGEHCHKLSLSHPGIEECDGRRWSGSCRWTTLRAASFGNGERHTLLPSKHAVSVKSICIWPVCDFHGSRLTQGCCIIGQCCCLDKRVCFDMGSWCPVNKTATSSPLLNKICSSLTLQADIFWLNDSMHRSEDTCQRVPKILFTKLQIQ